MKPVFLVGYMGAGKTTISKSLASNLEVSRIDLDDYIEEKEGRSILQIFDEVGEKAFRRIEQEALHSLKDVNALIATGGGTPCFYDNMTWMNDYGVTIYLYTHPNILFGRLRQQKVKRPLIRDLDDSQLRRFIEEKLNERSCYYERANIIYNWKETPVKKLIEDIRLLVD